jgi:protein SCO1
MFLLKLFRSNNMVSIAMLLTFTACKPPKQQAAIAPLPFYNTPNFTPYFISNTDSVQQIISHSITQFTCTNQNGAVFTANAVKGKIHIANFIFTTCSSICPTMTNNLKAFEKAFHNNPQVALLSFSVTPWIDSVPVLKAYQQKNNITTNNWHFLTGNTAHIYNVARQQYFAEEDIGYTKDSTEFLHTEHAVLVDGNMKIRGIYNATLALEIEQLVKDVQLLLRIEKYTLAKQ